MKSLNRSELEVLTNEELMLQFKVHDVDALNVLYRRYTTVATEEKEGFKITPKMKAYIMNSGVRSAEDAEEVFGNAWAEIIRKAESYEPYSTFHHYFLKTLDRRIIDKLRQYPTPKWKRSKDFEGEDPAKVQISRFTKKPLEPHELESYYKESKSAQGYVHGEQEPIHLENLPGATSTENQVFWEECAEFILAAMDDPDDPDKLTEKQRGAALLAFQPVDVLPTEGSSTPDASDDDLLSNEVMGEIKGVHPEAMKTRVRSMRDKLKKLIPEECWEFVS